MNVLLSIKPRYGEKILQGQKAYEFRKTTFSDPTAVDKIVMYASSPLRRLIGWFSLANVIEASPQRLWQDFGAESGVASREQFMEYYRHADTGYALEIDGCVSLAEPVDPRDHIEDFRPPVSFKYLNNDLDFLFN